LSQLFEIARLLVIREAREADAEAVGFAWANRIFPSLHDDRVATEFENDFDVSAEQVDEVIKLLDDDDLATKALDFYGVEAVFTSSPGNPAMLDRMQLINVMRYFFLDNRFDSAFWSRMTMPGSGPSESQSMNRPFNPDRDLVAVDC
jgi:hypothetical protein